MSNFWTVDLVRISKKWNPRALVEFQTIATPNPRTLIKHAEGAPNPRTLIMISNITPNPRTLIKLAEGAPNPRTLIVLSSITPNLRTLTQILDPALLGTGSRP